MGPSLTSSFPFATSRRSTRPGRLVLARGVADGLLAFGAFALELARVGSGARARLVVAAGRRRSSVVLRTVAGRAFLAAVVGDYTATGRAGHLEPVESVRRRYRRQLLDGVEAGTLRGRPCLTLHGRLGADPGDHVAYEARLIDVDGERLGLEVDLRGVGASFAADAGSPDPRERDALRAPHLFTDLFWAQSPHARAFGFGAQFTYLDMRGRAVPVLTAEQGVGRGAQPLTRYAEALGGAGGRWWSTYAPVPGFVTTDLTGFMLQGTEPARFDLRVPGVAGVRVYGGAVRALAYAASGPTELMELHTRETGRMAPLPDWAHSGAIVGMQGGAEKAERVVDELAAAGAPLAGVWLQDWVGNRKVPFGTRLWWDWQRDEGRYPDWHGMVRRLSARGVRVLVYVNPFLAPMTGRPGGRPALFDEAEAAGHFVKREDGSTYLTDQGDFEAGLVDLSSPGAREWYLETLTRNLLESGASGWMADFGEGLPLDARLERGSAHEWHNRYPEEWAAFNAELRERLAAASGRRPEEHVTFFRSGFTRSPGKAGLFWLGDQCVTWDRFDGVASALTGLLTSGFSGFALDHGDVGGYTSTLPPLPRTVRTPELLARWGELMAFTPVLRTHEGNRPEHNVQVYTDASTRAAFARAARLHASWRDLRVRLMAEAAATGMPVVRQAWLQYPADPTCADLARQLFLGPDLLVAPVLEEGAESVRAYLPTGSGAWRHRWSGEVTRSGRWVEVAAPLGEPGVFDRVLEE